MRYLAIIIATAALVFVLFSPPQYGGIDALGAISYPTSLDTFTNPTATSKTNSPSHATQHSNANDAIEALEAKVGADGSVVTTSHDYKLSGVTGSDLACSLTGTETLTNKTLTAPTINGATLATTTLSGTTTIAVGSQNLEIDLGSDATGDIYYRNSIGHLTRLGIGTNGHVLKVSGGLPAWAVESASGGSKVRAYMDSDMTVGTGVYATMEYDATTTDALGDFATSTYTFTAPADGYYLVAPKIQHDNSNGGEAYILVNNATTSTVELVNSGGYNDGHAAWTELLDLSQNDTVIVRFFSRSGTATVVSGTTESSLTITRI